MQEQHLDKDSVTQVAKTLQTLDMEAEKVYKAEHENDVQEKLKMSESDIAELAEEFNKASPGHVLLMDGNGYRMLLSLFANMLIAVNREDLADACIEARVPENLS